MTTTVKRRTEFRTLRVSEVERLCDDAVAVTFDVPDDLATEFAFRAGQSLTLRRTVDGRDERRSYSICARVGTRPAEMVHDLPCGQRRLMQRPDGVEYVFINGTAVVERGVPADRQPGRVLRGGC